MNGRPPVMKNPAIVFLEHESMNNLDLIRMKTIFTSVQYSLPLFWKKRMNLTK